MEVNNTFFIDDERQCVLYAIQNYDFLIGFCLDKCSIDPDSRVSTHPYFLDTRSTQPSLATLTTLYVERTHHCWKEAEVAIFT